MATDIGVTIQRLENYVLFDCICPENKIYNNNR